MFAYVPIYALYVYTMHTLECVYNTRSSHCAAQTFIYFTFYYFSTIFTLYYFSFTVSRWTEHAKNARTVDDHKIHKLHYSMTRLAEHYVILYILIVWRIDIHVRFQKRNRQYDLRNDKLATDQSHARISCLDQSVDLWESLHIYCPWNFFFFLSPIAVFRQKGPLNCTRARIYTFLPSNDFS